MEEYLFLLSKHRFSYGLSIVFLRVIGGKDKGEWNNDRRYNVGWDEYEKRVSIAI